MAGRKEYEMLFQLNAELGGGFNGAFSKAHAQMAAMQKEIQAFSKTQSDIAAYQKQQSAIETTKSKLSVLQQQYDNIQKEIKETEGYSSSLENKLLAKQQQIDKATASIKDQTAKLETLGNALKDAGVDTDNLSKESADLTDKVDELKKKQEEAAEGVKNYGAFSVEAFEAAKSAIVSAGLAKAYKEIAEEVIECVKASIEFESAITGVFKTVDGTDKQLAEITQGIKEMSTEIPATATEIAGVAEAAGQLGIATEDVLDFTRVMIDLGESTNLTADEAATSLAKFANITRTSADDYSRLGSVVVDLGNNFATTEADIVAMSTRLASAGAISGLSEPEIMALAAAMSSVGIEAEAGGTAMTQTLNAIETAVATNSAKLKEFARVAGMSASDFAAEWKNSPIVALQSFIGGLGSLDEKGESTAIVLEELGLTGIRQSNMLKSLGLAAETLDASIETANRAWVEDTALMIEANKRYATTESRIKMLQNSYGNLKVAVGDALIPELQGLMGVSGDVLDGITEFVAENPVLVKSVVTFTGVLGAATAGVTAYAAAAKLAKTLNLASTFATAGPIMLTVGAIAALAAGIVGVANAYEEAKIEARRYGDEVTAAADDYKKAMSEADQLEQNIAEWKSLNETVASGAASTEEVTAAKERLKETEQWLIDNYGIYMDGDGSVSAAEIESLEKRNEELRETARLKAEIALYDAKKKYDEAEKTVGDIQEKHDELYEENSEQLKVHGIMTKHYTRWSARTQSPDYEALSHEEKEAMHTAAMNSMHDELRSVGHDGDYSYNGMAGVELYLDLQSKTLDENATKLNEYRTELLEYNESALEFKQATRDIINVDLSDLPTDSLSEFAAAAASIGDRAADAEFDTTELANYAEKITAIGREMGLLPETQKIVFSAEGDLGIIEAIAEGADELDGKEVEIIATADAENAIIKIGEAAYKVLEYDDVTGVATLSADGKTAFAEIDLATGELRRFNEAEAEAYLYANTEDCEKNIEKAKSDLASLDGTKITVTTVFKSVYENIKKALGFGGYATGTESAVPGAHWVGEEGPELLWFDGGERVLDARRSAELAHNINRVSHSALSVTKEPAGAQLSPVLGQYSISIAPQFTVQGDSSDILDAKLQEFSGVLIGNIMDALDEAGINSKRGAYA